LIPAYNEERFIGSIVLAAQDHVDLVVVVDDGSRDRTSELARRAGAVVVQHQVNQGKAAAVNTGFAYVRSLQPEAMIMLDGDGQHCAADIPTVIQPVLDNTADIVVGSRFLNVKSKIPIYRQLGQHGLTLATNLASGVNSSDSQSGYRAFSAHALRELSFGQGGFSIESEMQFLARMHKLRVAEVPVHVIYAEPAKRNPFKHGLQVIQGILRMIGQTRPLMFFGMFGLVLFALGSGLGLYIIDIYSRTQHLAIGYALVTVLLCVIGVLLFFAGILLHSTHAMMWELRRTLIDRLAHGGLQQ
jgi:glycosyltransferase involved in cell wall biosynthesis